MRIIAIHLYISGRNQEADGSCIILHSLCAIQSDSFTNLLPCFLLISIEIIDHGGGRTPQARILRLAFCDDLIGEGDEAEGFFLVDDLGANLLNPLLVYLVFGATVYRLLTVVYEILYQIGEHSRVRILEISALNASKIAIVSGEHPDAGHISLLGIDIECLLVSSRFPQSPGINVAHRLSPW